VAQGADLLLATGILPAVAGARSVAEKLGIRYVYAAFQPNSLPSPFHPPIARPGHPLDPAVTDNRVLGQQNRVLWRQDAEHADELFAEVLGTARAAHGLPPVDGVRDYGFTDCPWLATDPLLGPWREPADLAVLQTGTWILPDELPLPDEVEEFLEAGEPPVYVGFGSMIMPDVARAAIEAVRAQGHRVLLSRGWAGLDDIDGADDCLAIGEVNHPALFKQVAAVVHHGGSGTTHTAARAGAPQLIVPHGGDQPYWGRRVTELGIGAVAPDVASLSVALKTALAAETSATAAAMGVAMLKDGAAVAAQLLVEEVSA